jgi:hypothetical protein
MGPSDAGLTCLKSKAWDGEREATLNFPPTSLAWGSGTRLKRVPFAMATIVLTQHVTYQTIRSNYITKFI